MESLVLSSNLKGLPVQVVERRCYAINKSTMNYLRYVVILVTLSTPFIRQKDTFADNAQSRNITQLSPCQNYDKLMPNSSLVGTNVMLANV